MKEIYETQKDILLLNEFLKMATPLREGISFHVLLHNYYWPVKCINSRACRRQNDSPSSFQYRM